MNKGRESGAEKGRPDQKSERRLPKSSSTCSNAPPQAHIHPSQLHTGRRDRRSRGTRHKRQLQNARHTILWRSHGQPRGLPPSSGIKHQPGRTLASPLPPPLAQTTPASRYIGRSRHAHDIHNLALPPYTSQESTSAVYPPILQPQLLCILLEWP